MIVFYKYLQIKHGEQLGGKKTRFSLAINSCRWTLDDATDKQLNGFKMKEIITLRNEIRGSVSYFNQKLYS